MVIGEGDVQNLTGARAAELLDLLGCRKLKTCCED